MMTILDILSTLDVNSDLMTRRADYWELRAARIANRGRDAQSDRILANVKIMRSEARRLRAEEKAAARAEKDAAATPVVRRRARKNADETASV